MSGPALPWACDVEGKDAPEDTGKPTESKADEAPTFLTLEAAGVSIGDRIEVKWQVEPDDEAPFMRWWGAKVVGPSDQKDAGYPGAPVYEIAYDAQDGFEQECAHVIFVAEHDLYQIDVGEELSWRRQGDSWECDPADEDQDGDQEEEAADGDGIITMDHIKKMVDNEKNYLGGKTLEEAEGEVLGALEPSRRIAVAAGFRDFADGLISFLQSKLEASGTTTVTEEHVREFTESLQKRQRTK